MLKDAGGRQVKFVVRVNHAMEMRTYNGKEISTSVLNIFSSKSNVIEYDSTLFQQEQCWV